MNAAYEFRVQCELTQDKFFGSLMALDESSADEISNVNHTSIILPQVNGTNLIKEEIMWDIECLHNVTGGEALVEPLGLLVSTYDSSITLPHIDESNSTKDDIKPIWTTSGDGATDQQTKPVVNFKISTKDEAFYANNDKGEYESKVPKGAAQRRSQRKRTVKSLTEPVEQERDFKSHQTSRKTFKSNQSHAAFNRKSTLLDHQQTECGEKPFKCHKCKSKFKRKHGLVAHQRMHSANNPIECDVCKAKFSQYSTLVVHQRIHTGEKPFQCDQCKVAFAQNTDLVRHRRTHTGEKPFKCNECKAAFVKNYDLMRHRRTHTGEKAYKCNLCKDAFRRNEHLVSHQRMHTGESPFKCDQCKAAFKHKSSVVRHQTIHATTVQTQSKLLGGPSAENSSDT